MRSRLLVASGLALAACLSVLAPGCGGGGGGGGGGGSTPPGTGTVNVVATDAAFPYPIIASATIQISDVRFVEGAGQDVGFVNSLAPSQVQLIGLNNGTTAPLANGVAPVGSYSAIKIFVSAATVTLTDGRTFPAPGAPPTQTELVLTFQNPLVVTDATTQTVLVDFDLARSVTIQTNQPQLPTPPVNTITDVQFVPVGRAVVTGTGGTIQGVISDRNSVPLTGADVRLLSSGSVLATTASGPGGQYKFLEIAPGSFTVTAAFDAVGTGSTAVVMSGTNAATANVQLTNP